ncbi:ABC transporter permease [Emticicia sp. BO119]|uniref:ABC transporter permease n=1 Tax=Emticicia sp. BO119 TaxID=2757768 RepID=UPI0015F0C3BD|nr:ABC transporter permease [Emticicia sp. BO119]MBA4850639.1 ABC transporter permease [Emticicia sp. BO119]
MNQSSDNITPPRWADQLLEWFCAPHLLEEVQGDLYERFQKNFRLFGERIARREYAIGVLSFLRPFAIKRKKPIEVSNFLLLQIMISNYFKIAFRNLLKNLRFTTINIVGMTLGMACALVIFLIVRHETSYDLAQSKLDRIYRVETQNIKEDHIYPGTYTGMTKALYADLPEAEKIVPILKQWGFTFSAGHSDNRFKESFVFADNNLFKTLDYQWLAGDANRALTQPNTIIVTRKYAEKYFGKTDILGETIRFDNKQDLMVTGVLEDYPTTSSFPFDMLVSFSTLKGTNPNFELDKWNGWNDNHQVYVLLKKGVKAEALQGRFKHIVEKYIGKEALPDKNFLLSSIKNIHYTGNLGGRTANTKLLKTLSLIGLLVLLISCFNFINLSTAQLFKRAKEVGVRKVIGSSRQSLIYQFLTEAGLITGTAIMLAVLTAELALPSIAAVLDIPIRMTDLFSLNNMLFVLGLFVITTLLAGVYPAIKLSGMTPMWALNKNKMPHIRQVFSLRQALVVVQFTVSLVLISSAILIDKQLSFFQKADLGFNKDAIITINLPDNSPAKLQSFRNQLVSSAQIKDVSFSMNSASSEGNWMQLTEIRDIESPVQIKTQMKMGDSHFLDTYGIQLLAGRALKDNDTTLVALANEIYLDRMGIKKPEKAIGRKFYYGNGEEYGTIVGVVKNFNVNSLHQKIDPTLIQVVPKHYYQGGIKLSNTHLSADDIEATVAHIEKLWTATFPGQVFEYNFLNEELEKAYQSEMRTARLIETATFMAVLIACLGLLGLATFIAEQRTKEIGVRKVLGASVSSILVLLSKDFLKLVLVAIIIATPVAWWAIDNWLQNFEFKIHINGWIFIATGLFMALLAILTVSFQSLKAALINPVKSLKTE